MPLELEDDSIAPHVQLIEKVQQFEEEQRQQHEREEQAIHEQIKNIREEKIKEAKAEVERILDKTLGPRPVAQQSATPDLWEDELASVQDQTLEQYDKKRETLRKELMEDKLEHIEEVLKVTLEDPDDIDMDFQTWMKYLNRFSMIATSMINTPLRNPHQLKPTLRCLMTHSNNYSVPLPPNYIQIESPIPIYVLRNKSSWQHCSKQEKPVTC